MFSLKKSMIIAVLFAGSVLAKAGAWAAKPDSPHFVPQNTANCLKGIDSLVETALELFHVPGAAVGVLVDGEVILAKGYGLRNREAGLPVDEHTLFAIGSCTKAITAYTLGILVEQGIISWDDPVIQHIPEFSLKDRHASEHATIRDLLAHRTGLPRHDFLWYNSEIAMQDLLSRLPYLEPACDLRERFYYNNIMYAVAGIVTERVLDLAWEEAVAELVFNPASILNSNFSVECTKTSDNFSLPHFELDGEVKTIAFRNIDNIRPAGAINSSVCDMLKWIQLNMPGHGLVKDETLVEMQSVHIGLPFVSTDKILNLGYGLGWMIGVYDGRFLVEHAGGIDGFVSRIKILPREKIGIVVLTNTMEGGKFVTEAIGNSILDRLLNSQDKDWLMAMSEIKEQLEASLENEGDASPDSNPAHPLDAYVGEYEHPGYGIAKVVKKEAGISLLYNRIETPLISRGGNLFVGSKQAEDPAFAIFGFTFLFEEGPEGSIHRLSIPFEEVLPPILFTRKLEANKQQ